jgi:hypothetical protein
MSIIAAVVSGPGCARLKIRKEIVKSWCPGILGCFRWWIIDKFKKLKLF